MIRLKSNQPQSLDIEEVFIKQLGGKQSSFKTLFHLYQGNILDLLGSLILYFIKSSPIWIIPLLTAEIIDMANAPGKHSLDQLWMYLIIILISLAQNIPMHTLHTILFSRAIRSVEAGLRSAMVRKLQHLSITYHKELKSGKLQAKILRDVEAVEFLSRQMMTMVVPSVINCLIALVLTLSKSISVTLFFLATIPVSTLMVQIFRKSIHHTNNYFRKEIEAMSSKVSEMVEMIPVTRAHGLERVEMEKVADHLERVKEKGYQLDIVAALFGSSTWVAFQIFQVLCLVFTVYLAFQGKITVGEVVMYQGFFNSILSQVNGIINIYPQISKGFESLKSISEVLLAQDIEVNNGKERLTKVDGGFSFKDVYFHYPPSGRPVLNGFNLEVKPGECIAFVGESGAGKTTILNLIIGFVKPTRGEIRLDGKNLSEVDLRTYRNFIAVVPQNTILFSGSIRENITYGLSKVDEQKLDAVIESANIKEFAEMLPQGLNTPIGEHGGKLSGGQRQRIAIARALLRDPRIIVLDEATSALDNISELQVQKAMKNLMKDRTTFIVAHRLSTIRDADRIVVVKDGTAAEYGTYEELMALKGEFYHLKKLQA